eukprot:171998-Rhodomonas_salina.1
MTVPARSSCASPPRTQPARASSRTAAVARSEVPQARARSTQGCAENRDTDTTMMMMVIVLMGVVMMGVDDGNGGRGGQVRGLQPE